MKTAYFDCFSGISGNMILGAILDAGVPLDYLQKELAKLLIEDDYELVYKRVNKSGINTCYFNVVLPKNTHSHHHGTIKKRNLHNINTIIQGSSLDNRTKELVMTIFSRLGEAEAKVHNCSIDDIWFHESGAIDTIIDIVGAALGLHYLGIERVYSSPLHVGSGTIKYRYGVLPIPAPATAELIKNVPFYSTDVKGELVTPTGAAIITTIAEEFCPINNIQVETISYGAATINTDTNDFLRLYIGSFC